MAPLDKCMGDLRRLIAIADTNGIGMAERAVDEFLAVTPVVARQAGLNSVQQVVTTHRDAASGIQRNFADTVNDYIEKQMRRLE